jgi:hypothetical protein
VFRKEGGRLASPEWRVSKQRTERRELADSSALRRKQFGDTSRQELDCALGRADDVSGYAG